MRWILALAVVLAASVAHAERACVVGDTQKLFAYGYLHDSNDVTQNLWDGTIRSINAAGCDVVLHVGDAINAPDGMQSYTHGTELFKAGWDYCKNQEDPVACFHESTCPNHPVLTNLFWCKRQLGWIGRQEILRYGGPGAWNQWRILRDGTITNWRGFLDNPGLNSTGEERLGFSDLTAPTRKLAIGNHDRVMESVLRPYAWWVGIEITSVYPDGTIPEAVGTWTMHHGFVSEAIPGTWLVARGHVCATTPYVRDLLRAGHRTTEVVFNGQCQSDLAMSARWVQVDRASNGAVTHRVVAP